jgi:hypothetical protein
MPSQRHCPDPRCRAYNLTTNEFMRLGGEDWSQSFRSRIGKRAGQVYERLYGMRRMAKVRANQMLGNRNKVRRYPCGVLEQAYRELVAEGHAVRKQPAVFSERDTAA